MFRSVRLSQTLMATAARHPLVLLDFGASINIWKQGCISRSQKWWQNITSLKVRKEDEDHGLNLKSPTEQSASFQRTFFHVV